MEIYNKFYKKLVDSFDERKTEKKKFNQMKEYFYGPAPAASVEVMHMVNEYYNVKHNDEEDIEIGKE